MRRGKFNAVPTVIDNVRFASKREAHRYMDLKMLQAGGAITALEWDKSKLRYDLRVNGLLIARYEADFRYFDRNQDRWVVEDSKGFKTPAYRIKRKLMKAIHNIEIQEV